MARRATDESTSPAVVRFAERLQADVGATRVLLFGSRARGDARRDSDFDFIIVAPCFAGIEFLRRGSGLWQTWRDVGGYGPIDLICITPQEFTQAQGRITLIAAVLPEAVDLLVPAPAGSA